MNISPAEVEALRITHPAIADVACVPVQDALGERLCVCVAAHEPLTLRDLTGHLTAKVWSPASSRMTAGCGVGTSR
jgi:non-ribosomal peptide synthetase component E (peptide arylation enzyme)